MERIRDEIPKDGICKFPDFELFIGGNLNPDFFKRRLKFVEGEILTLEEKLKVLKEEAKLYRITLENMRRSELEILMAT